MPTRQRSGLDLAHRPGLKQLLQDVIGGSREYDAVLVYDVSRWGRFQDTDESAYYEFLCKRAGVRVHYCAELFSNDGSLIATLMKTVKRAMAGEFLRELSVKVSPANAGLQDRVSRWGDGPGTACAECW